MILRQRIVTCSLGLLAACGLLTGCEQEGEATAYTFYDVYVGADYLIENRQNISDHEDIYLNEDGSLTLELTESQRKKWADPSSTEITLLMAKTMGLTIEYSDDYTKLSISAPTGVAEAASPMILNLAWSAELYQVLNGTEDWSLEVIVENSDTGEIMQRVTLPEEELDWSFISQ